ncbi:MAG: hypothetical protein ACTSYA_08915 [Candidatus Kariarchaeaceae archaeon]
MKANSFDVTGTPYDKIESLRSVPNFVEKIAHWLQLSTISHTPLRDKRDGAYTLAVVWAQSPDFFIEIDSSFRFVSFFSNVVTSIEEQSTEKVCTFLKTILQKASEYPSVRPIISKNTGDLRTYNRWRADELNLVLFLRIVRETAQYLNDLAQITVEQKFKEIWRETEGEERESIKGYDHSFEFFA